MHALTKADLVSDVPATPESAGSIRTSTSRRVLQIAVNLVFGMPFFWGLLIAVRGRHYWGNHRIFGDVIGLNAAVIWAMVAALGALWLGVSLVVTAPRAGRVAGSLLILSAVALLIGFRP